MPREQRQNKVKKISLKDQPKKQRSASDLKRRELLNNLNYIDSLPKFNQLANENITFEGLLYSNILDNLKNKITNNKLINLKLYTTDPQEQIPVMRELPSGEMDYLYNVPDFALEKAPKNLTEFENTLEWGNIINKEMQRTIKDGTWKSTLPYQMKIVLELNERNKQVYSEVVGAYLLNPNTDEVSISMNAEKVLDFYELISDDPQELLTQDLLNGLNNAMQLSDFQNTEICLDAISEAYYILDKEHLENFIDNINKTALQKEIQAGGLEKISSRKVKALEAVYPKLKDFKTENKSIQAADIIDRYVPKIDTEEEKINPDLNERIGMIGDFFIDDEPTPTRTPEPQPEPNKTLQTSLDEDKEETDPALESIESILGILTVKGFNVQNLNITLGNENSINAGNTVARKQSHTHTK